MKISKLSKIVFPVLTTLSVSLFNNCNQNPIIFDCSKEKPKSEVLLKNKDKEKSESSPPEFDLKYSKNVEDSRAYLKEAVNYNPFLRDSVYLLKNINQLTKRLEHSYVQDTLGNDIFYRTDELNLEQLQRIYLMMNSLKEKSFRQEIGQKIKDDVEDQFAEHGGLVFHNKGKIYLKSIESCLIKDTAYNTSYCFPTEAHFIANLGKFHIHAEDYTEQEYAHPSNIDLTISYYASKMFNESNEFVITSLEKGKFNIDYYGGNMLTGPLTKVFDLGNYYYDTLNLK